MCIEPHRELHTKPVLLCVSSARGPQGKKSSLHLAEHWKPVFQVASVCRTELNSPATQVGGRAALAPCRDPAAELPEPPCARRAAPIRQQLRKTSVSWWSGTRDPRKLLLRYQRVWTGPSTSDAQGHKKCPMAYCYFSSVWAAQDIPARSKFGQEIASVPNTRDAPFSTQPHGCHTRTGQNWKIIPYINAACERVTVYLLFFFNERAGEEGVKGGGEIMIDEENLLG